MKMVNEIRYICKDCGEEFKFSKEVYDLMSERGESIPERCKKHRKDHKKDVRDIELPYFGIEPEEMLFMNFSLSNDSYTFHGERNPEIKKKEIEKTEMKIRITDEHILELYEKLDKSQVVVLASPTGTGKSTFIPYRLILAPLDYTGDFTERLLHQGQFIQTQPLSSAVERIPETIGEKLLGGSGIGEMELLGLRHRGDERYDRKNLGVIVTDGSLRNWIRDGHLCQYSLIMVDEAHQRTCNIDTILMLLKNELLKHPQLRLIVSSATINVDEFKETFQKEGISVDVFDLSEILKEEKNYCGPHFWKGGSIENCDCWLCSNKEKREKFWQDKKSPPGRHKLAETVTEFTMKFLKETETGSILIFLQGESAIEKSYRLIKERKKIIDPKDSIPVIPIYSRLGEKEVAKRFNQKGENRRVLIATNIAETSHTLDDVVYVIDSGYIKESQWDPETEISSLSTRHHSKAGCKQRWGRVGRVQKGYVYCLYSEEIFKEEFNEYTRPEIFRSCLDDPLLTLKAAGITERIPWVGSPGGELNLEIERSSKATKREKFIDNKGDVTDKVLEIFHIPRPSYEVALIQLAEKQNCLPETMTALLSACEEEIRTGAELYDIYHGLLIWDERWTAATKARVYAIQQGLKIGCRDDLDLIIKLSLCFRNKGREWVRYHFVNRNILEKIISDTDEFIESFREKTKKAESRKVNIGLLDKVRSLMPVVWPEKLVDLNKGEVISYPVKGKSEIGMISPHCAGNWKERKRAIITAATEKKVVFNGDLLFLPTASFTVQTFDEISTKENIDLFIDQKFPVDSLVYAKEENGRYYLEKVIETPSPVIIGYRRILTAIDERPKFSRTKISFQNKLLLEEKLLYPVEGIWISEKRSNPARIVGWIEKDGEPLAILSSFIEGKRLVEKKGEYLKVKINQVNRDPNGKSGWIIAVTEDGFEIPVEMAEMSLSYFGPGLKRIEGETLDLVIKDFNRAGCPKLSNIDRIIQDLKKIKKEIFNNDSGINQINLKGYIEDIREERITVVVPRELGVVHSFETVIDKKYLIRGEIDNLKIGQEIIVKLSSKRYERDKISINLTEEEYKTKPRDWEYDIDKGELFTPFCIEYLKWRVRPEVADFIKRHSWQYCFDVKIVSLKLKERLSSLNQGDSITGIVEKVIYDETGENIDTIDIVFEDGTSAFAFGTDLDQSIGIPSEGEELLLNVSKVDPESGFLKLVSREVIEERQRKKEEYLHELQEYMMRCQDNINRWNSTLDKNKGLIEKVEGEISECEDIKRDAYDPEEVQGWINEKRSFISKLKKTINETWGKIESVSREMYNTDQDIKKTQAELEDLQKYK